MFRRMMVVLLASAAAALGADLIDIDGNNHGSLEDADRSATVLYFITNDCPISNQYAPEMNRICDEYAAKGVGCYLVYTDPTLSEKAIRQHISDYSHDCCATIHDTEHELVNRVQAKVTPEVALLSGEGEVAYQGRINDFYASLGKPRRFVSEHNLRDALDAVLAHRPVEVAETDAIGCFIPDLAVYRKTTGQDHHDHAKHSEH